VELRRAWKVELDKLVTGDKVSDDFFKQLNHVLAEDVFHETLHLRGKAGFHHLPRRRTQIGLGSII
jgi:hypothetical protein